MGCRWGRFSGCRRSQILSGSGVLFSTKWTLSTTTAHLHATITLSSWQFCRDMNVKNYDAPFKYLEVFFRDFQGLSPLPAKSPPQYGQRSDRSSKRPVGTRNRVLAWQSVRDWMSNIPGARWPRSAAGCTRSYIQYPVGGSVVRRSRLTLIDISGTDRTDFRTGVLFWSLKDEIERRVAGWSQKFFPSLESQS